ncbi:hypothetical protein MC7420_6462 [Coleofasciculus chthonoplastes PCC 7420]|uniref:Uncharacterized protein n=1 Tax=Coleofasciculus chthonoplastes PCC 7420 TaxID=118168 RepID=B4VQN0_9CYAN|nr:hypothetical protein MC7420_6462 [Coleofasciculus chthonoplastes PCC 7420]
MATKMPRVLILSLNHKVGLWTKKAPSIQQTLIITNDQ